MSDETPTAGPVTPVEDKGPARNGGIPWGDVVRNSLLVIVFFAMLWLAFHVRLPSAEVLRGDLDRWGGWAWAVFVLFYAVLAITPIPVSVLATTGGLFFGVVEGSFLSVIGAMLGSWAATRTSSRSGSRRPAPRAPTCCA